MISCPALGLLWVCWSLSGTASAVLALNNLRTGTGRQNWASKRSLPHQAQPCQSQGGAAVLGLSSGCDLQSHLEETRMLQLTLLGTLGHSWQTHKPSLAVPAVPSTSGAHTLLKRLSKKKKKSQIFQRKTRDGAAGSHLTGVLQVPFSRGCILGVCGLSCAHPAELLPHSSLRSCVEHPLRMSCHLLCL